MRRRASSPGSPPTPCTSRCPSWRTASSCWPRRPASLTYLALLSRAGDRASSSQVGDIGVVSARSPGPTHTVRALGEPVSLRDCRRLTLAVSISRAQARSVALRVPVPPFGRRDSSGFLLQCGLVPRGQRPRPAPGSATRRRKPERPAKAPCDGAREARRSTGGQAGERGQTWTLASGWTGPGTARSPRVWEPQSGPRPRRARQLVYCLPAVWGTASPLSGYDAHLTLRASDSPLAGPQNLA
jgi:hypothetical protein